MKRLLLITLFCVPFCCLGQKSVFYLDNYDIEQYTFKDLSDGQFKADFKNPTTNRLRIVQVRVNIIVEPVCYQCGGQGSSGVSGVEKSYLYKNSKNDFAINPYFHFNISNILKSYPKDKYHIGNIRFVIQDMIAEKTEGKDWLNNIMYNNEVTFTFTIDNDPNMRAKGQNN